MKLFAILSPFLLYITGVLTQACTRENILGYVNAYLVSQTDGCAACLVMGNHNPNGVTYQQNNKIMNFTDPKSILNTPLKIDFNRTTVDLVACASYTMWMSVSGGKQYVGGVQITISEESGYAKLYDNIVATTGDLFFNATKTLGYVQKEDWTEITDVSRRPSRELLKKVGDAYLDMWTDKNAADSIPWGTDCERVEGSQYTNPCGKTLPRGGSAKANGMRRYVIDETKGSVDVLCQFDSLGAWPDSHEIRVVDGKVKYVNTVTVTRGVGA